MYSAAQLDKRRAGQLATAIQTAFQQYGSLPPHPADVGGLAAHGVPSNLPVGNTEPDDFNLLRKLVEIGPDDAATISSIGYPHSELTNWIVPAAPAARATAGSPRM